MISTHSNRLESIIVGLLAKQPLQTASRLHKHCCLGNRKYSLQIIYHHLRKLQTEGVVIKAKDRFSLSLTWAYECLHFADLVYSRYLESPSHLELIPEDHSAKSWQFSNLLRLDNFWVQAMIAIFSHSGAKLKFGWNPHPWFYFAQPDKVQRYYAMFKSRGWRYFSTIGGDTYLDQRYAESMDASFYEYRLNQTPVFDDMSRYYSLIGDYIIAVKLDQATSRRIDELFMSIKSESDIRYHQVSKALNTPGKLSITIEHNPRKAGRYTRKFREYFGV